MKKRYLLTSTALVVLMILMAGCAGDKAGSGEEKALKPVTVLELKEETKPLLLHYTGVMEAEEVKKYAFGTSGRVAQLFVREGDEVRQGDKLASLEQDEPAVTALDVEKARANYDFVRDYHTKMQKLSEAGMISAQELQESALKLDLAQYSLDQAQKLLALSAKNTLLTADRDGYVLKVLSRETEVAAAGSPVVVVASRELQGSVGLREKDLALVRSGTPVTLTCSGQESRGVITHIRKSPDEASRAYLADIKLEQEVAAGIGTLIKVTIPAGEETGIWVPVQYILNDGEDHVYLLEDGRARRKNVRLGSLLEDNVKVEGLKPGDILIADGGKSVRDGYAVTATATATSNETEANRGR